MLYLVVYTLRMNRPLPHNLTRSAFTLIELLVVIAIIAILAVVVVLTLNPAQLLAQSRDANRVSDMATLNSAINLYQTDQAGASSYTLGNASTSYLSIPSASSTCATLGMATSAYSYQCSSSSNYRNASSTGWLPLAFNLISAGSPISSLPVDPTNQSSSNLYYSYETNGSQYALSAFMESSKYAKQMETTGGMDPALYEAGSGANTLADAGRGLVGYWPLDEGTGNTAYDWSGEGNNGTWHGTATGTSGYYSLGHVWQWAGAFDGTSTYVGLSYIASIYTTSTYSFVAWFNSQSATGDIISISNGTANRNGIALISGNIFGGYYNGSTYTGPCAAFSQNVWNQVVIVNSGGTVTGYLNGSPMNITGSCGALGNGSNAIGWNSINNTYMNGLISDVRVYDRALSASEIQEIYNAEK